MTGNAVRSISREGSDLSTPSSGGPPLAVNQTHMLQQNPFALKTYEGVIEDAKELARDNNFSEEDGAVLLKGAALAKAEEDNRPFEDVKEIMEVLDDDDKRILLEERANPWSSLSKNNFTQASTCAGCAIVQGADQTIINGAQVRH